MNQTYKIKAKWVEISNVDRRRPKSRPLREVIPNLHVGAPVDHLRDHLDRGPQGIHLGPIAETDLLVDVPAGGSPDAGVLGLQPGLDLRHDLGSTHTSPPSSAQTQHASGAVYTTPRVGEAPVGTADDAGAAAAPPSAAAAPKLYYQDRLVTIYHGDSLLAPELWVHADVMITDPPYGLQALAGSYGMTTSEAGPRTIANDFDTTTRDRALELWGDKPVAVFGTPRLEEPPGGWTDRLVWDKMQLGLNGGAWRYAHETIFVRGEGWRRISDASSSILRHSSPANRRNVRRHIHSKPEKLLADLIASAPPGVVVDPFAGGGSTVAAARALGRSIVAFELEEEHCETIVERITSRLDLGEVAQ